MSVDVIEPGRSFQGDVCAIAPRDHIQTDSFTDAHAPGCGPCARTSCDDRFIQWVVRAVTVVRGRSRTHGVHAVLAAAVTPFCCCYSNAKCSSRPPSSLEMAAVRELLLPRCGLQARKGDRSSLCAATHVAAAPSLSASACDGPPQRERALHSAGIAP